MYLYQGNTKVKTLGDMEGPSGSLSFAITAFAQGDGSCCHPGTDYRILIRAGHRLLPAVEQMTPTKVPWLLRRPVTVPKMPEPEALASPEIWSEAFEIRQPPFRAVSKGDRRDVITSIGLEHVNITTFRQNQKKFEETALSFVRMIDDSTTIEVMEILQCPCEKTRATTSTMVDSLQARDTAFAATRSGRRLTGMANQFGGQVNMDEKSTTFNFQFEAKGHAMKFSEDPELAMETLVAGDLIMLDASETGSRPNSLATPKQLTVVGATSTVLMVWEVIDGGVNTIFNSGKVSLTKITSRPRQETGLQVSCVRS